MDDHVECRVFDRIGRGDYVAYSEGVRYHLMNCQQCHRRYLAARQEAHRQRTVKPEGKPETAQA